MNALARYPRGGRGKDRPKISTAAWSFNAAATTFYWSSATPAECLALLQGREAHAHEVMIIGRRPFALTTDDAEARRFSSHALLTRLENRRHWRHPRMYLSTEAVRTGSG